MKRIVILEGPDAAGKTTLADFLDTRFSVVTNKPVLRLHFGKPEIKDWGAHNYGVACMLEYLSQETIIIDRFHWSELAYGRVIRKGSYFDENERTYYKLIEKLNEFHTFFVLLMPPFARLEKRYKSMYPDEYKADKYQDLYVQYQQLWAQHHFELPSLRITDTFSDDSVIDAAQAIMEFDRQVYLQKQGGSHVSNLQ